MADVRANTERTADEVPEHSPEAHDAITAELVACTLGARRRPELRVDPLGRLHHNLGTVVRDMARALAPLARAYAATQPAPPTRWQRLRARLRRHTD